MKLMAFQIGEDGRIPWYSTYIILTDTPEQAQDIVRTQVRYLKDSKLTARRVEEFDALANLPHINNEAQIVGCIDGGHWDGDIRTLRGLVKRNLLHSFDNASGDTRVARKEA